MSRPSMLRKLKSLAVVSSCGALLFGALQYHRNDEKFFRTILMPASRLVDPETAHTLGIFAFKWGLVPKGDHIQPESLRTNFLGLSLENCVGVAAGFDKNAEGIVGLHKAGFGFVEVGTVTPYEQPGNPQPRVFRLIEDEAVINRYGFNSEGYDAVWKRIREVRHSNFKGVIGVNLGKNKTSEDPVQDYTTGIKIFGPQADYLVINVSSPNTPGLRSMQNKETLRELLTAVMKARNLTIEDHQRPVLLKLAPDLTQTELSDIVEVLKDKKCKVDGLIVSNTTIQRNDLKSEHSGEAGGLSGKPVKDMSTQMIANVYQMTNGKIPIIGVGGIANGQDAYEKILAGASVVQIYTSFIFQGPPVVNKIKQELDALLQRDGYTNVSEAVGKSVKKPVKRFFLF